MGMQETYNETKKYDMENFQQENTFLSVTFKLKSINAVEMESGAERLTNYLKKLGVEYQVKDLKKRTGKVSTRKGPSGQGTCTIAKYKIMVHSKDITFKASNTIIGQVSSFIRGIGVEANVFMS